jgi:hypothetical protein
MINIINIFYIFLLLYYVLNNQEFDIYHIIRYGALLYVLENNENYLI